MNKIQISKQLEKTTYLVVVTEDNKVVSSGSGVSINQNGFLLTAAHVLAKIPVSKDYIAKSKETIFARTKSGSFKSYKTSLIGLTFTADFLRYPITIDLALLVPNLPAKNIPFIPISNVDINVGLEILMAGFPDEMELPFSLDKIIDYDYGNIKSQIPILQSIRQQLMIKSGIVGYRSNFTLNDTSNNAVYNGNIIYMDNVMHSGASGGPVVDLKGTLIGIITERAITSVPFEENPKLKVPSGSAVAISAKTIISILKSLPTLSQPDVKNL